MAPARVRVTVSQMAPASVRVRVGWMAPTRVRVRVGVSRKPDGAGKGKGWG